MSLKEQVNKVALTTCQGTGRACIIPSPGPRPSAHSCRSLSPNCVQTYYMHKFTLRIMLRNAPATLQEEPVHVPVRDGL